MVKPIPVFAFVFAAYAATHAPRRDFRDQSNDRQPKAPPPASPAWRTLARQGADVWVKVGIADDGGRGAGRRVARLGECGDDVEEIWLGRIVETAHGFSGSVAQSAVAHVRIGQRLRFARIHVLGWTMGLNAPEAARAGERERAPV